MKVRTLYMKTKKIDPETGDWPEHPLVGLLYPNDETHRGEGHISYLIHAKKDLPTGAAGPVSSPIPTAGNPSILAGSSIRHVRGGSLQITKLYDKATPGFHNALAATGGGRRRYWSDNVGGGIRALEGGQDHVVSSQQWQ